MRKQVRFYIDDALWAATEAAATAIGISHSAYIERSLKMAIDPVEIISNAAKLVLNANVNLARTQDSINVIADYVVDQYRDQNSELNTEVNRV